MNETKKAEDALSTFKGALETLRGADASVQEHVQLEADRQGELTRLEETGKHDDPETVRLAIELTVQLRMLPHKITALRAKQAEMHAKAIPLGRDALHFLEREGEFLRQHVRETYLSRVACLCSDGKAEMIAAWMYAQANPQLFALVEDFLNNVKAPLYEWDCGSFRGEKRETLDLILKLADRAREVRAQVEAFRARKSMLAKAA